MSAATDTKEVLDVVAGFTKQIIDAATPVAKQAYEVGLMTLRIDAAQSLFTSIIIFAICAFILLKLYFQYEVASAKAKSAEHVNAFLYNSVTSHLPLCGGIHLLGGFLAVLWGGTGFIYSINFWIWVKLFSPELWLAHQAIEKVLK